MKICAACREDLPKDSYSKKQWKLDEYQRRCKVCITNNREAQEPPPQKDNNDMHTNEIINKLNNLYLENVGKISDEELFKQPPPQYGDCPICFLRLPELRTGWRYQSCCGKVLCSGCVHAPIYDDQGNKVDNEKCPFCRTSFPESEEEWIERTMKRVDSGDPLAINNQGCNYRDGRYGLPVDYTKALELFYRAAKLGDTEAYLNIGYSYENGRGVDVDLKKAKHYYELASMKGNEIARHNLGAKEADAGNWDRALKHWMIAAGSGFNPSLKYIQDFYSNGRATKEDYTKALQAYQKYLSEIKSAQRDDAAAAHEDYRYY